MFTIAKRFEFSASHQLGGLPPEHQCSRLHGHNYVIEVELAGDTLDDRGFVMDYGDLKPLKQHIDEVWDHRHINDIMGETNPTAEHMAQWFYDECRSRGWPVHRVGVSETPKTWAWFGE